MKRYREWRICVVTLVLWLIGALHPTAAALTEPGLEKGEATFSWTVFLNRGAVPILVICAVLLIAVIVVLSYALRQRGKSNRRIWELLYLDALTGTRNFNYFCMEAPKLLAAADGETYALVYSDIERFKYFNDMYGYAQGDLVLKCFAQEMTHLIGPGECFARIANDHFVTLVKYTDAASFEERLRQVDGQLSGVTKGERRNHRLVVVNGVCLVPPGTEDELSSLIDCANTARKTAKGAHKSTYAIYDSQMRQAVEVRLEVESDMDQALEEGQFVPYLQPQFQFSNGRISGMEALVRWQHPRRGLVAPWAFIPLFEQNGFIIEVDFSIFEQCCRLLERLQAEKKPCVPLSCNFSRLHLRQADFVQRLCGIADRYRVPHALLQLEITESAAEESQEQLIKVLTELRDLGFSLAIDDFGSGYSSLNFLKSLPVDTLKLDKDFLQQGIVGKKDRIIIEGFVTIAKRLKLTVICEGVETETQAEFLRGIGCHVAQGFLYAKPQPVEDALALLEQNHRNYTPEGIFGWPIPTDLL